MVFRSFLSCAVARRQRLTLPSLPGAAARATTHHPWRAHNLFAYAVGGHRHQPEHHHGPAKQRRHEQRRGGAQCRNQTTGQVVPLPLGGATSWDCQAAGLTVSPGNVIRMIVAGCAQHKEKCLSMVGGTQRRHQKEYVDTIQIRHHHIKEHQVDAFVILPEYLNSFFPAICDVNMESSGRK